LPLFLIALLIVATAIALALAYKYVSLKGQVSTQVQEQLRLWRDREIGAIRSEQLEVARREMQLQSQEWKSQQEQTIRQDAIQKSQAVTLGKITEHLIPFFPDFCYCPKDARFIGSPIDFVVFDGLNEGEVKRIVFVEVKTGASVLSAREKWVRSAVQAGKVEWMEIRSTLGGKNRRFESAESDGAFLPALAQDPIQPSRQG